MSDPDNHASIVRITGPQGSHKSVVARFYADHRGREFGREGVLYVEFGDEPVTGRRRLHTVIFDGLDELHALGFLARCKPLLRHDSVVVLVGNR